MISTRPRVNEVPKHPLPHVPPPQEPQGPHAQPPTVFVYERLTWEYQVISKNTADDGSLAEEELNALGKDGWELVGVIPRSSVVEFYFKRAGD